MIFAVVAASPSFENVGLGFALLIGFVVGFKHILDLKDKFLPKTKGEQEVVLSNKPLEVRLEEQFPTRREFERLEDDVREVQKELPKMERRIITEMKDGMSEISNQIDKFGSSAHAGRGKIWNELNEVRERVSGLESKTDGL